ncbi:MAG: 3,4-dihydroxy-2-butanone-4-phosphate synthase, partial [Methylococcales bacterium]|nr:3,4-dihydroxy-2-butanone-4-phosphate synthase [Methylococcales bacterium]
MDDEDRENEGDLIMAATKVRPEDINFMVRYGRGLVCLTLTPQRCQQLRLPLMVNDNQSSEGTNFTVSIEAAKGVTTGISAADRAATILAAVADNAKPEDVVMPGHIFPLMAQSGGVLIRAGHTEAGCDLSRLAGLDPSSVIVEILNEDGSMARRPDLEIFAKQHDIKMGTIADLIHYRTQNEKTIERINECQLPTKYGEFKLIAFQDCIDNELHLALVKGKVDPEKPILVRVHMEDLICDLFEVEHNGCGWPLSHAFKQISAEENGVILILRRKDCVQHLVRRIQDFQLHDADMKIPTKQSSPSDLRTYGVGAQILSELGVRKMRVLSAPKKVHGLSGFGMEIVEYVECE